MNIRHREARMQVMAAGFDRLSDIRKIKLVADHYLALTNVAIATSKIAQMSIDTGSKHAAELAQSNLNAMTEGYELAFGQTPPWATQPNETPRQTTYTAEPG